MKSKNLLNITAYVRNEDLVLILILAVLSTHEVTYYRFLLMAFIIFSGILVRSLSTTKWYWMLCSIILLFELIFQNVIKANHSFLLFFLCLGFATTKWQPEHEQESAQKKCMVLIMGVVLLFATVHKLFSSYYLSGYLLMDYLLKGSSLESLGSYFDSNWANLTQKNMESFHLVKASQIDGYRQPAYLLFPHMEAWLNALAWLSVLVEGALVFLLFRKGAYSVVAKGFLLLAMILGIYVLRDETAFMAIMSGLGFMIMKDESVSFAHIFLLLSVLFCTLTLCDWRPPLLQ
ncbi:MAG: hypothetical protein AAF984_06195 [Verrucomicrobiota bacterium]